MPGADYSLNVAMNASNNMSSAFMQAGGFLASLGAQAFTTGVGFNGMASSAATATAAVQTGAADATVAMEEVSVSSHRASGALLAIGTAAVVAGVALVGIGVAATKEAGAFQTAMLSNVAHAGLAQSEFQHVSDAILAMAPAVGRSPTQLAEAMYPILSAFSGVQNQAAKSAIALDTLKMSFQTVAGTTVDGTAVANAAVGTFNALGLATNNVSTNTKRMTGLFDVMDKTVMLGNMQWDQYKNVVSKLAIGIQGTNVSFNESQAALATLTNRSYSAQKASTYLNNTFTTMVIKTDAMAKHAKKLGISFDEQKYSSMDLADKIEYLNKVTGGNSQKVLALLGNNATALKTFNALKGGIKDYKSALDSLNHSQGALKSSFDTASQGFNFQMTQVKAAGDALMITIGTQLLPVVSQFAKQLVPLIQQFTQWLTQSGALQASAYILGDAIRATIFIISAFVTLISNVVLWFVRVQGPGEILRALLIGIAVAFAAIQVGTFLATVPAIVAGFVAWATAAGATAIAELAAMAPLLLIGAAIAVAVALIILAVTHWGAILDWITNKTEQTRIKVEIANSQQAVKTDQQQKQSAQNTLKNLEKEKADILAKMKTTHDAATKAEYQKQLDMTQRQIDGQNARIAAADKDAAAQKAKQKKLHDDLIESQKDLGTRIDDIVGKWLGDTFAKFNTWRQQVDSIFNKWVSDTWNRFTSWVGGIFSALGTFVHNFLSMVGQWKDKAIAKVQELIDGIRKFFAALPGEALQWGKDLIQNLINGISSMLGNLSTMASNAANTIASVLHFTHPSKGPLMTVEQWMPHLGDTLIMGLNRIAPQLQASALKAAAAVAGPIKGSADGSMPSHIFDFIGSNYSGYSSGMATTAKREEAAQDKAARHAAVVARQENALDAHIAKLETHYNIVVHAHGKGKWTKADATELAKLLAEEARLQGKHPQTASGRRN